MQRSDRGIRGLGEFPTSRLLAQWQRCVRQPYGVFQQFISEIMAHVNDAGFWMVKEYFGMTVPDTMRSWTLMKIMISLFGFSCVLLFQALRG